MFMHVSKTEDGVHRILDRLVDEIEGGVYTFALSILGVLYIRPRGFTSPVSPTLGRMWSDQII